MSKKMFLFVVILVALLAAIYSIIVNRPTPEKLADVAVPAPRVMVIEVSEKNTRAEVKTQGIVQPKSSVDIVSRVSGKIESVSAKFDEGGFFVSGEEILRIEDNDYRIAVIRAKAQLANAQQALAKEKGLARQAAREWRDLGDADANALFRREPQLAAAQAGVLAAKADIEKAELDLGRTIIRAPYDVVIAKQQSELGQFVSPGQKLATLYGTAKAQVRLALTDRQLRLLELPRMTAASTTKPVALVGQYAGQEHTWSGIFKRVEAELDRASQTTFVIVEVNDPYAISSDQPRLPLGLFVQATIEGRADHQSVTLPRVALMPGNIVYLVDSEDHLQEITVEVLLATPDIVIVKGAVSPGDKVVVQQVPYAFDGMSVAPITEAR